MTKSGGIHESDDGKVFRTDQHEAVGPIGVLRRNRKRSCGGGPLATPFFYEYKRKRQRRQTEVKNMERVSIL